MKGQKKVIFPYTPSVDQSTKLRHCWISLGSKSFQWFNHLIEQEKFHYFSIYSGYEDEGKRMGRGLLYYIKPITALFLTSNVILFMLSISDLKMPHLSLQVSPLVLHNHPSKMLMWWSCYYFQLSWLQQSYFGDHVCDFQRDKSLFGWSIRQVTWLVEQSILQQMLFVIGL